MSVKSTILLVEDDLNLMQGIQDILELHDYEVVTANNGLEALTVMNQCLTPPDLIVSDIMMPSMNGYQLFDEIRKNTRWAAIPFIFLTARGDKSDVRDGISRGVDDYMVKPFNAEDLLVVVDARLRRSKELKKLHTEEITDLKRGILTILNHEFRTPLTYIVAYADMLNQDTESLNYNEINTFLRSMNVGAERLRRLIENFILLVELEMGEARNIYEWRKKPLDNLQEIIEGAWDPVLNAAQKKGLSLQVEPLPNPPAHVVGDAHYLKIALTCLFDNSIKFTDAPDRLVTLSFANAEQGGLLIAIADQGRGIPEPERDAIFDVMYQIDRATLEDQGAGIGLPIVKRIMDLHGGDLSLQSEVGVGSCFTLYLPPADQ
jgi:two-component system sensor histidine kinase/response regulator